MFRLTRTQIHPIGLDLGSDSIKMLQVEVVGDNLCVCAAHKEFVPDEARVDWQTRLACSLDLVKQHLKQNKFRGRNVVANLPREMAHIKNLRLPVIPAAEMAQAVGFEARNLFGFDAEEAMIRLLPAGEVRQGTDVKQEVIVVAVRNVDVDNYVEQLHQAGCVVESLDIELCSLYRSIEKFIRRREDEVDVHVMVDVGWQGSQVVIGRGREISFYKPIDVGGRHLHEAVSRRLNITVEEAKALRQRLVSSPDTTDIAARRDPVRQAVYDATRSVIEELGREISLCLRYYTVTFRGQRPSRLRLVGGEACDPHLVSLLNSSLAIPVEASRSLYNLNISAMKAADRCGPTSEWAIALGLALKTAKGNFPAKDGKPRDPATPFQVKLPAEVTDVPAMTVLSEEATASSAKGGKHA